jgi:hypothetical protein
LHNEILELRGNVRVYARVRPLSGSEAALGDCSPIVAQVENQAIALIPPDNPQVATIIRVLRSRQPTVAIRSRRNVATSSLAARRAEQELGRRHGWRSAQRRAVMCASQACR